jgi:uncharacterized protein YdhG (YjbR/CyaY superfamily)
MGERSSEIDAYLEALPVERREALSVVRSLLHEVAGEGEETIWYGLPTVKYKGKVLGSFAAQKRHLSLYVIDVDVVEAHRHELKGLSVAKAAIRFKRLEQLPLDVVRQTLVETKGHIDGVEGDRSGRVSLPGPL